MNIVEAERSSGGPLVGIIVSLGGQTPLKLADRLPPELILGTAPSSIDTAEDRDLWADLCERIGVPQPPGGTATTVDDAVAVAQQVGYPALVRPSYVLGGRAMELVYNDEELKNAMRAMADSGTLGREGGLSAQRPVLIDRFLESAIEVDVDAIRDSTGEVVIGGVMEHVEEAGVHSGDSACVLPPRSLSAAVVAELSDYVAKIASELDVRGLLNVQFAVRDGAVRDGAVRDGAVRDGAVRDSAVFVIEANPRASRTVPFVAKATGRPLAKLAARVMAGATLAELRTEGLLTDPVVDGFWAVKEAVLPFNRFPASDALLGPEMRSTGEVMGIDVTPGLAFVKSQLAAGTHLPQPGGSCVFMSLADRDKAAGVEVANHLAGLGFCFVATAGTAEHLTEAGIEIRQVVNRLTDQNGATAVDLIEAGKISMVINTPRGRGPRADGAYIRQAAGQNGVPLVTTVAAALAAARGMVDLADDRLAVRPLQAIHSGVTGD